MKNIRLFPTDVDGFPANGCMPRPADGNVMNSMILK